MRISRKGLKVHRSACEHFPTHKRLTCGCMCPADELAVFISLLRSLKVTVMFYQRSEGWHRNGSPVRAGKKSPTKSRKVRLAAPLGQWVSNSASVFRIQDFVISGARLCFTIGRVSPENMPRTLEFASSSLADGRCWFMSMARQAPATIRESKVALDCWNQQGFLRPARCPKSKAEHVRMSKNGTATCHNLRLPPPRKIQPSWATVAPKAFLSKKGSTSPAPVCSLALATPVSSAGLGLQG